MNEPTKQYRIEEFIIKDEPFYVPSADEVEIFEAAYRQRVPVLLKGPTGTGKTRFVEYMAWKLGQPLTIVKDTAKPLLENSNGNGAVPLVTVACHEDLTASDLVGRYLLDANGTRWIDGPLTRAVKAGGICYLDEVVEARKDTTVIIHPLTDHRRLLTIDKLGEVVEASWSERDILARSFQARAITAPAFARAAGLATTQERGVAGYMSVASLDQIQRLQAVLRSIDDGALIADCHCHSRSPPRLERSRRSRSSLGYVALVIRGVLDRTAAKANRPAVHPRSGSSSHL